MCRIAGAAGVAGFLVIAFTPLPNALDRWLTIPARIEPADAIVVLAAGLNSDEILSNSSMRRALRGITLYKLGLAPLDGPRSRFVPSLPATWASRRRPSSWSGRRGRRERRPSNSAGSSNRAASVGFFS